MAGRGKLRDGKEKIRIEGSSGSSLRSSSSYSREVALQHRFQIAGLSLLGWETGEELPTASRVLSELGACPARSAINTVAVMTLSCLGRRCTGNGDLSQECHRLCHLPLLGTLQSLSEIMKSTICLM